MGTMPESSTINGGPIQRVINVGADGTSYADATSGGNKVTLATRLDQNNDAMAVYEKQWTPINLTASGQLLSGAGAIKGFYVNSTSSGTIVFRDALTETTPVVSGTITPAVGFHPFPASMTTGAFVTIGGTLNVTFFVRLGTIA